MSSEHIETKLDHIAEQLVMSGLGTPELRNAVAGDLESLSKQVMLTHNKAYDAAHKLAEICRTHQDPAELNKWVEETLLCLRKELVEHHTDMEYPAFLGLKEKTGNTSVVMVRECDPEIFREFVVESREHLEAADVNLMTLENQPENAEALNAVFRAFHTIKGVAGLLNLSKIQSVAHESENLLDRARKGTLVLKGDAIDVTFEAADTLRKLVQNAAENFEGRSSPNRPKINVLLKKLVDAQNAGTIPAPTKVEAKVNTAEAEAATAAKTGAVVFKPTANTPEPVVLPPASEEPVAAIEVHEEPKSSPVAPVVEKKPTPSVPAVPVVAQAQTQVQAAPTGEAGHMREVLKVDAERLDRLVNMIGELVIAESMVSQSPELRNASTNLARYPSQLDKITRELQEVGTSLRMIPIRGTFQKMQRLVRDLSKKTGKQVDFAMTGEETELDKGVVEKIGDPLIHMIRNSCDHGIEPDVNDRIKAGKNPAGRVELRAFHRGGNIIIEIADDGRGLNKDAILKKAIERGLVREGQNLSDREIFNLIFAPGLSTAKQITDVSGRGVGMDVVKRNIEALRGQIDIQSEPGKGTTFTIRLPLTLAIIDGMLVRAGNERYVIPTLSIVRSVRPSKQDIETVLHRGEMLKLQGQLIPVYRLHKMFGIERAVEDLTQGVVVIVEDDGKRAGILADELLGQQQIVIKNLGEALKNQPGISGGAIMSDGNVGLILDVSGLIRLAHTDDKAIRTPAPLKAAS